MVGLTRTFFVLLDGARLEVEDRLDDDYTGCEGYEAGDRVFVALTEEWSAMKYKESSETVLKMKEESFWEPYETIHESSL